MKRSTVSNILPGKQVKYERIANIIILLVQVVEH